MQIKNLMVRGIFDSRGRETLELGLTNAQDQEFWAQVSSGESAGSREAVCLKLAAAKESVAKLKTVLVGRSFTSINEFDQQLLAQDDSAQKNVLGGNVLLGLSVAMVRALAAEQQAQPWQLLKNEFFVVTRGEVVAKPAIIANFFEGGLHANSNLDIQEYHIITAPNEDYYYTVAQLALIYEQLRAAYIAEHHTAAPISDESALAANFKNNLQPILTLQKKLQELKLEQSWQLGIDAAASSFYQDKKYKFERRKIDSPKLIAIYQHFRAVCPQLLWLEDPFAESDLDSFAALRQVVPNEVNVIGDDLTCSNAELIRHAANNGAINAVIIKPNQIGTVSQSCQAINTARDNQLKVIVSHRARETEDAFIIQLAKACNADAVKIGVPLKERVFKYNELLRLYE